MLIVPSMELWADTPGYDPNIRYKLSTQLNAWNILYGVHLMACVICCNNKKLSNTGAGQKRRAEYEAENNPVLSFIEDRGEKEVSSMNSMMMYLADIKYSK